MKRNQAPSCPMEALLRLISGPWTLHIVWVLSQDGPKRFGELKRAVPGISTRVLTERLRMLESAGILWREQAQTIPPSVTYGLTSRGAELHGVLQGLGQIAARWQEEGAFGTQDVAAE